MTVVAFDVDEGVSLLWTARVPIAHGLTDAELQWNESRFDIEFGADHAALLRAAVPTGPNWPDWRSADPNHIRASIAEPVEGVLFDVEHNGYWHRDWAPRPREMNAALEVAREGLAVWPRQVPVYGHRYQVTGAPAGSPVLSIYQTDVVIYGANLLDYLRRELLRDAGPPLLENDLRHSDPWLELAFDSEPAQYE